MDSDTFVEAEVWTVARTEQGNAVLIRPKGSEVAVPIFVGPLEAQAILIGLGGVDVPRPLTPDLLLDVVAGLGAEVARVEISELRQGTFFARLVLGFAEEEIAFDARPSDAISLAVRTHCPLFIAESVVEEAGISIHLVNEAGEALAPAFPQDLQAPATAAGSSGGLSPGAELALLEVQLEKAVEEEDYESAARLRDRIRELGGDIQ